MTNHIESLFLNQSKNDMWVSAQRTLGGNSTRIPESPILSPRRSSVILGEVQPMAVIRNDTKVQITQITNSSLGMHHVDFSRG